MAKVIPLLSGLDIRKITTGGVGDEEVSVAKLKQKDTRPTYSFFPGDIVTRYGAAGPGIVLYMEGDTAYCIFRPREFQLRSEVRRIVEVYNLGDAKIKEIATPVPTNQLSFEEKAPKSWMQLPTAASITQNRFADILDEEEDDGS